MKMTLTRLFKVLKRIIFIIQKPIDYLTTYILLFVNGAKFSTFKSNGVPKVNVSLGGSLFIGENLKMNNRENANPIGRFNKCSIIVGEKGVLKIGNNLGMSSTAIFCSNVITIGNNVRIGGNVVIYDTDFHSLNPDDRNNSKLDKSNTKTAPVFLEDNCFIGAHSTILKGVIIGENSIIGACSVVTKSIPKNEIWAGNPAKFIKHNNDYQ
jgi:acetyltransferase-like isoleucine patch superfamily enzyme